ncbi:MAG: hemolysin family protein [Candidatus Midichloria mitochondrii]|nr:hemolysin family protein [Candidatus Midichloria mitochondrii]MDJ1288198.1 hemolysin family protein [Candidatus Midichloria mitochondrii]MDJ1299076.1 hemolysin family protein [Candidatus Midichloria mitochondrii]MDJ1312981.1 hemolysin family protein [Candidatus Midichloria mitochondrii]MDJ1583800.1 hemolysin family protein [Candidatus Midichloria mitochondrii]
MSPLNTTFRLKKLFRLFKKKSRSDETKQNIDIYIDKDGHIDNDLLNTSERNIIENLLSFRDLRVSEVMIPRTDLIGIEGSSTFEEIKQQFTSTGYTRMPVYRENLDDIVGFLHIKDFIHYMDGSKAFKMSDAIRKIIYSPRSTKCIDLLSNMRNSTTHIAVVLDEYGGTEGMVVIENLIEKIVGDMRDEHDQVSKVFINKISENHYTVDARAAIQDVEEILNFSLSQEDGEYETFGGFILSYLDRVPLKGEKIMHPMGLEIEIIEAEPRKIKSTKIKITKAENSE